MGQLTTIQKLTEMKKLNILWMVALMVLALPVSCIDELVPDGLLEGRELVETPSKPDSVWFTAILEQGVTKTALTQTLDVVWQAGDQIRVYNSLTPAGKVFTLTPESDGSTVGRFAGEGLSGGGPYYAVYPASAGGTFSQGKIAVTIPDIQMETPDTFAPGANISTGMAAALDQIYFQNVCGVLAVTLKGDVDISEIIVFDENRDPLCGDAFITPSDTPGTAPVLEWNSQGTTSSQLEYISAAGASLTPEGTTFYVVLPAGTLSGGFTVEVHDCNADAMVRHAKDSGTNTIERSTIRPMPAIDYVAEVSGSFLYENWVGAYADTAPGGSPYTLFTLSPATGQYAFGRTTGENAVMRTRITDYVFGYSVSLSIPQDCYVGGTFPVTVEAFGETGGIVSAQDVPMKILKATPDGLIWLTDGNNGYIMRFMEEQL